MQRILSEKAYNETVELIPGGVNSPVRALKSVGASPVFVSNASKSSFKDIDNNRYIDFCLSWGVFILGHSHPAVKAAARRAIDKGSSYGIPSLAETELAQLVAQSVPSVGQVRFVSSGTEAVMSAIRLARGFTGRKLVVKFDGCYHGHSDSLLVSAGSGVAGLAQSSSAGVPGEFTQLTISLPFNDTEAVKAFFAARGSEVAAVILEPVPANMGVVLPKPGYLQGLRDITRQHGALLIFDEVITGFRLGLGGAQQRWAVTPDLTTLGKIIGGGFPAAAFGGRRDIMQFLAPVGPVYQAGTLSGNPVAMAAGVKTLTLLSEPGLYSGLDALTENFVSELKHITREKGITIQHTGSMFTLFFSENELTNFEDVKKCDTERFAAFYRKLLAAGIYFSPSQFEACFLSVYHTEASLERVLKVVKRVL